jgi:hypothetical protein
MFCRINFLKISWNIILFLFLLTTVLVAEEENEEEDYEKKYEIGARFGLGYHAKDKFESNLGNYRGLGGGSIIDIGRISPFRSTSNMEFFARVRWSNKWKFGILFGNTQFQKFHFDELDGTRTFSRLNFNLNSDFLFMTCHYEWKLKKSSVEFGGGIGINNTSLSANGYIIDPDGNYSTQKGSLIGNGLAYRLEGSWNKPITQNILFQIGVSGSIVTAPYFDGSLGESLGTYYINANGTVSPITTSQYVQSSASSNYGSRRLDMVYGYFQIYAGTMLRFSF